MSNDFPKLPNILDTFHQEHWYLTKLLALLSVIAITSLGSFSLAQHLLPQGPIATATSEPAYTDGVCDADPKEWQAKYSPVTSSSRSSPTSSATSTSSSMPSATATPNSNRRTGSAFAGSAPSTNAEMEFVSSNHSKAFAKPIPPTKTTTPPSTPAPTPTPAPTSTSALTSTTPANWNTYGFNDDDIKYAEACAAKFVYDYHTFDYADPATLEKAVPMLSAKAKKLFYLGGADDKHHLHLHMLNIWQKDTLQKNHLRETATIQQPTLENITPAYSNYLVEAEVRYTLVQEINGQVSPSGVNRDTVILQNTAPSPKFPNAPHGWMVVDWIDVNA